MANIIRPSFSFKNLPIYRVKSVGKETKNASVPHSLDFTRQVSTVEEAPLDGGKYVRYNESWFNILAQLNAIDTLDQYLMKSEEDKGTEAVDSHELEYDHTSFLTSADISNVITENNIGDFLPSIDDFNPSQFELNSSNKVTLKDEIIPTDVSDLDDNTNLIPPHLFFDDTYFSGAGTQVDPKSLRTENLPSGGGGVEPKGLKIERENGIVSKIIYDDGNELIINRLNNEIVGFEDDNYIWAIERVNNLVDKIKINKK